MYWVRFVVPLLLALVALAIITTPLMDNFISGWFRNDVRMRSELVFQSVEDSVNEHWNDRNSAQYYQRLFNKIETDARVIAVGVCTEDGKFVARSSEWPTSISCPTEKAREIPELNILVSTFPLSVDSVRKPFFIVLHDLTFSSERTLKMKMYLMCLVLLVALVSAVLTILTARLTLRGWLGQLRQTLSDPKVKISDQNFPREFIPVVREVRQMLRELKHGSYAYETIKIDWTPDTLRSLLEQELPGSEVMIVSNREPYIHNHKDGKIELQRPASGLVTALEPITRACGGTWIAHGSGSADQETSDANGCVRVPPENPEYTLKRVWLSEEEEDGYYYGFANEGMWPLCHITFVRPVFRDSDWEQYKAVNRKFADAVVAQAKTENPIVLVQDYHLALAPKYIREKLPKATILTFWHIPWPNAEVFSICPWREEILEGLLGSSILGFHTQFHCQNFMESVDRFLESHINREQSVITAQGHPTLIRPYPISIAWPPEGLDKVAPAEECRKIVRERFSLAPDVMIGVGVERFDYTKGIIDRFLAIRELLKNHPEWRGKFSFIQAAAPTRARLPAYKAIQDETINLAEEINKEFGSDTYQPIILLAHHHEPEQVFELFRASDFCVVSSLHDGMNLVAKEYVASRDDDHGVLILSTFAGASKELLEALLVNPYDAKGMAEAMHKALIMPDAEEVERMKLMRDSVRDNTIYRWAARILLDAARLRKRARVESFIQIPEDTKSSDENVVSFESKPRRIIS